MGAILTIDLGTTLFKLSLFDQTGRLIALVRVTPPIAKPTAGRWELSPVDLRRSVVEGIARLRVDAGRMVDAVEAVSFATQANSFVLMDAKNTPLTPLILWPDERAAAM